MADSKKPVFSTNAGKGTVGSIEAIYSTLVEFSCGLDKKDCNWGLDAEKAKQSLYRWAETADINSSLDVLGEIVTRVE